MTKIILNIPENEFGVDIQNKFQDFFGRVKAEIETRVKSGDTLVCGAYEIETAEMFLNAFKEMQIEERKVGKWIAERDDYGNITGWHCSNCYDKTGFFTTCAWDYCPNCGAEMRGVENDSIT